MIPSETTIQRVLDAAAGADFAEVFCEDSRFTDFTLRKEGVDSRRQGRECGVGIRLLSGDQCRYAFTNDSREETLLRLTRELARGLSGGRSAGPAVLDRRTGGADRSEEGGVSLQRKLEAARRAVEAGLAYDSEIVQMSARYLDMDQRVLIANTEGLLAEDRRVKTRLQIMAFAQADGALQSGFSGPGAAADFSFYDTLDVEGIARRTAETARTTVHAEPCPSGMMTVVAASGFAGLLFHEACGHSLEASSVAGGNSEFSGRLGQRVASPVVTLVDDGTLAGQWGSLGLDDEGAPTQRNVLIENGVLKGYLIDRLGGRRMGAASTGSGRRQNYRFPPEARMTNTFIAPGESSPADIIAGTERGLYVGSINGGSVNPVTGEFNFNATGCWLIENGRLTRPVRNATLIGRGGEVLRQVDMVGDDLALGQGYCYNNSGALFICAGQPTLRVQNMLVGGMP